MALNLLVVEDEVDLATALVYALKRDGFSVRAAHDGNSALLALESDPIPDAVVLDLMLPDMGGLEICRRIRASERLKQVPILMLTAKAEEFDRVNGFQAGADDYVTKPFSTRELLLRIKAILRRSLQQEGQSSQQPVLSLGILLLDPKAHRVYVDKQELVLTALEFRLLFTLLSKKGEVQSRATLLEEVWGISAELNTRTVDTHVKRLRSKLGAASDYIETIRGVGYRMLAEVEA